MPLVYNLLLYSKVILFLNLTLSVPELRKLEEVFKKMPLSDNTIEHPLQNCVLKIVVYSVSINICIAQISCPDV